MNWLGRQIKMVSFYINLYKASRLGKKFYAEYEHLARDVLFHPEMKPRLDVYSPATGTNHPVLVFMHGGGWKEYDKELFAPVAMRLVTEDMVVVIPDYTLYPDARYEQMTHEVAAALSWTLENIEQHRGDPRRVVIAGHSAGAHLMGLAVMDPRFLPVYGHNWAEVYGMIGVSGVYDIQAQYEYDLGQGDGGVPEMPQVMGGQEHFATASPINYVQPDLPPVLLIHGAKDDIVPLRSSMDFHAALQKAGARSQLKAYHGSGHSDILFDALTQERAPIVVDFTDFVNRGPEDFGGLSEAR